MINSVNSGFLGRLALKMDISTFLLSQMKS
jgi:hypothetical protein